MEDEKFDIENIMAEIKIATPEFVPFLAWVAGNTFEDSDHQSVPDDMFHPDDCQVIIEAVYSYSRAKNEEEEERMMDARA